MPDEKIVYFVRHGQSEDNVGSVFQGLESPLNATGKEQARRLAERITHLSFDALIASPLPRAKATAEAISLATGIAPEYSDLFVERGKPKRLNNKPYEDKEAAKLWEEWDKSLYRPGMRIEDGENFDDIMVRADKALAYLKERPEKSLVVATHGYFLRTLVARVLLGENLTGDAFRSFQSRIEMENTGITVLKYGKRWEGTAWSLWIFNDHAHLG